MDSDTDEILDINTPEQNNRVARLLRQLKEVEELSKKDKLKLHNLKICLRHKVLPQHEVEARAGSHAPTPTELEKFMQIVPLKKGFYLPDEDEIIINNWKEFCKMHNWRKTKFKPFLLFRDGNKSYIHHKITRRKFVQFLADGLPNRTLYSVYHRFRVLFSNHILRRYNKEEDELILDHLENNPTLNEKRKLTDLARVLSRTRQSIWRRYERLKRYRDQGGILKR